MGKAVKKVKKVVKKVVKSPIGKVLAGAAGFAIGGPAGAAIASGATTKLSGGSIKDALMSAGLSYAGGSIGGKLMPQSIGSALSPKNVASSIGGQASRTAGMSSLQRGISGLSGVVSNALPDSIANASIGSTVGSFYGNSIADSLRTPQMDKMEFSGPSGPAAPTPFKASQSAALELPGSLSSIGGLTPEQQSSNIATQGVYGGGSGPDEQSYFMNLVNRRLVDESGTVDQDLSEVSPIESSYLAQLGLGGYSNPNDLLEAMSKWKAA